MEGIPIEIDRDTRVDTPVNMDHGGGGILPISPVPPIDSIDPLVRPRGLPIVVPQNFVAVDMPSHLPKFYESKDDRDHAKGHSRGWKQVQREFLNDFRPEVGQSMTLRALSSLKQGREEEISAYIRRFDLLCTRFVGTMLNDDTLKQFFIQEFFKLGTIRGVLERNPQTLADGKKMARETENFDRDHERL